MSSNSKLKKKALRVKCQKVKLFRANEPFLSVLMWGVNQTIQELSHINIPIMLMPEHFKSYSKIKVDNHFFNKENMPSHFKVKEYCPLVFRNLRERFGIDDADYLHSLTRSQPIPFDSPGRSGARFFHSFDKLYVIKTLPSEEVEKMHYLLKEYHPFIVERHGKTLLPQYLGMYRLTVEGVETYLVVTRNVFSSNLRLHKKYDLKGSTIDREATEKEKNKHLPTLKDMDFVKDGAKIHIGGEAKEKLMDTISADVEFLKNMHVMDYSLLVGVHDVDEEANRVDEEVCSGGEGDLEEDEDSCGSGGLIPTPPDSPQVPPRERTVSNGHINPDVDIYAISSYEGAPKREIYFLGIIDVLTHYGMKKQAAKAAKTVKYGSNVDGISTIEPEGYAKRFLDFMARAIE